MAIEYPYSDQAEKSTLGAMIVDEDAQKVGLSSLIEEDFYLAANRLVFDSMKRIEAKQKPIDITTVTDDLEALGKLDSVGGVEGLTAMVKGVVTSNIDYYIEILKEKTNFRNLLDLINEVVDDVSHKSIDNSEEYLAEVEKRVVEIARNRKVDDFLSTADVIKLVKEKYYSGTKRSINGVTSGYKKLDEITDGFKPGDYIVLAARTSVGKTQFAINMAMNAARETKKPIGFFSVEMPAEQIVNRMISTATRIPNDKLKKFDLTQEDLIKFEEGINRISDYEIYFDETSNRLIDIQAKARKLKSQFPDLAIIFIDYLQLISNSKGEGSRDKSRAVEVGELSHGVKKLAMELQVPIVCLAQVGRSAAERGSKEPPKLNELRESGDIENDADMVIFIHRPDYYQADKSTVPDIVEAQIIVAKNRNGRQGKAKLTLTLSTGEFNSTFSE